MRHEKDYYLTQKLIINESNKKKGPRAKKTNKKEGARQTDIDIYIYVDDPF